MKIRLPGTLYVCLTAATLLSSITTWSQGVYRFWGVTKQGGDNNTGVLFRLDSNGNNYSKKHDFKLTNPGAAPYYTELTAYDGRFYGMTIAGGDNNNYGVIFEWDPAENIYTKKYDFAFDDAWFPYGSLTLCNGKFYGMTNRGGSSGLGVIFEWDPVTNVFTKKINLDDASGHSPEGSLTEKDGKLYGMTKYGGNDFGGVIFEYDPASNEYTKKVDLNSSTGRSPYGKLTLLGSKFYGMTGEGGNDEYGVIFEWDPATNVYEKKLDFNDVNGKYPFGSLTVNNGKLYGMTSEGGVTGFGVIFEWDPSDNSCTKKVDFDGSNGRHPYGTLTAGNGKLCGMTWMGGPDNFGMLFEWDPANNTFTRQIEFNNAGNGANPYGSLTWSGDHFFGITTKGGAANAGVIFEWDPVTDNFNKKIDMNIAVDGSNPDGKLTMIGGKIYGATTKGGSSNNGLLFEYNQRNNSYIRKIEFEGSNGAEPNGDLVVFNAKVYGLTKRGGINGAGTIFEWEPATNSFSKKYDFNYDSGGEPNDGQLLYNGKFYGTTSTGGVNGYGVIYEWDPASNVYTKKYDFDNTDGSSPNGYLVLRSGKIYGMTRYGGINETGVIFEWDPASNVYSKKYEFATDITGVHPRAGLTLSQDGNKFYGTTRETRSNISFPGQEGPGVIFEWDPVSNVYTKKVDFDGTNGGLPIGNLTESGGKYYGLTSQGGDGPSYPGINIVVGGSGVVFEWDPATNICVKKADLVGNNGAYPSGNDLSRMPVPVANGLEGACTGFNDIVIDNTNNNKWVAVVDNNGDVVAEIKANGNNLGVVSIQAYINSTQVREDMNKKLYLDRSLTITPQVQPVTPVEIRLYIRGSEFDRLKTATNSMGQPSGIFTIADIGIFKNNDACVSSVQLLNNPVLATGDSWSGDYVLSATVSSFSSFYFGNKLNAGSPLPMQFLTFTGRKVNNDGLLEWETTNEDNTKSYEVERSTDGDHYSAVGTVTAFNSPGTHQYNYTDQNINSLGSRRVYYRLNQKDRDGGQSYSKFVLLSLNENSAVVVLYPNPVKSQASLMVTLDRAEKVQARIMDNTGRVVRLQQISLPAGRSNTPVDMNELPAGMYYLELKGEAVNERIKIIKN